MRIGVEVIAAGSVLGEGQGGASGYIEALIPALLAEDRVEQLFVYVADWYQPARYWTHPKLVVRFSPVPTRRPLRVGYEQLVLPAQVRRDRVDVMFCTGNFRPLGYRRPNVLALHAIQHFLLGDDIGRVRSAYVRFAVPRSARSADVVVAVSEALRQDAIRLFDLDPNRIVAVHMGPSPWVEQLTDPGRAAPEPYATADRAPYVLSISRLYALKNHRRLIEAFAKAVRAQRLPHRLVIVGGDADVTREELAGVAAANGIADRVSFLGRVPQADVPGLYAGATAVAYTSLYETFGHPVLEAFATERPLVTSDVGGTAETAGDAARLVSPTDIDDIAAGLCDVLTDEQLRERLVRSGRARLRDFTWQRCAAGTIDAFEQALRARA